MFGIGNPFTVARRLRDGLRYERLYLEEKDRRENREKTQQIIRDHQIERTMNGPCIFVPNEYEDMVVGVMIGREAEVDISYIDNYLTGKTSTIIGLPIPYTRALLDAFLKLDPVERWLMRIPDELQGDKHTRSIKPVMSAEEVIAKLESQGFFDDFPQ